MTVAALDHAPDTVDTNTGGTGRSDAQGRLLVTSATRSRSSKKNGLTAASSAEDSS